MADRGIIYATTGAPYTTLARRSARALRAVWPDIPIDLFSDQPVDDPTFDQVHPLAHRGKRPKIEALRESRFDRTFLLDADTLVLTPTPEVFDVLDRGDFAAVPGTSRMPNMMPQGSGIPRAFPLYNAGVIAVRRSERMTRFLTDWEEDMISAGDKVDQRSLRRQLWAHTDITVIALQQEYNVKALNRLDVWPIFMGAPRILHQSELHEKDPGDPAKALTLTEVVGKRRAAHVEALMARDWDLGGTGEEVVTPDAWRRRALKRLRRQLAKARGSGVQP